MRQRDELEAGRALVPVLRKRQQDIHDETPRSEKERVNKRVRLEEAGEVAHRVHNGMADRSTALSFKKTKRTKNVPSTKTKRRP